MNVPGQDRPFMRMAIGAANIADDERLNRALLEIAGQFQSRVTINSHPQNGLYNLEGRSESDLDLICDRVRDDYHLEIDVAPPQAILIETIRKPAEGEGKYIRQTGGFGNYGHCKIRIEPAKPGAGYEFINEIRDSAIPSSYILPVEEGVQAAMSSGVLAGHPLLDVRVMLLGGSYHESDSNEMAFKFAGSIALKEAARKACPVILEPMMSIEMEVLDGVVLAIRDEISAHRGRIERDEPVHNGLAEIKAVIPLSELLVSTSGVFDGVPVEFAGYEPVQDNHSSDAGTAGVTADKPDRPRFGSHSEKARREPEED